MAESGWGPRASSTAQPPTHPPLGDLVYSSLAGKRQSQDFNPDRALGLGSLHQAIFFLQKKKNAGKWRCILSALG